MLPTLRLTFAAASATLGSTAFAACCGPAVKASLSIHCRTAVRVITPQKSPNVERSPKLNRHCGTYRDCLIR